MVKFEDMNKQQLNKKVVELEGQKDDAQLELDNAVSLLNKVCAVADFDTELAQLDEDELKSLGLEVPLAIINRSHQVRKLEAEIKKYDGMLAAVNYYIDQKTNSDG